MNFFSNNIEFFTIFCMLLTMASIVIASMAWRENNNLNRRLDIFMRGRYAENLESYFVELRKDIDFLAEEYYIPLSQLQVSQHPSASS